MTVCVCTVKCHRGALIPAGRRRFGCVEQRDERESGRGRGGRTDGRRLFSFPRDVSISGFRRRRATEEAFSSCCLDVALHRMHVGWTFHGPITRDFGVTSGVSLILRDDAIPPNGTAGANVTHFALIATANTAGGLFSATSTDLLHWTTNNTSAWCTGRHGKFDQKGIAAGPQAERLSDGNYLYLYSIDNVRSCQSAACGHGCGADCAAPDSSKGCYGRCTDGRCALGWMILDKDDPLTVIARAEETLLFAELPFETTGTAATGPLQTPWVVFTDGLQKVAPDEFIVYYGGGDTNVGAARIKVTVPAPSQ